MNTPREVGRRYSTVATKDIPVLAFAALGGILGAIALLLWLSFGLWTLAFVACIFAAAAMAKVLAMIELRRMTREIEYQRRTRWEAGVGQHADVEA